MRLRGEEIFFSSLLRKNGNWGLLSFMRVFFSSTVFTMLTPSMTTPMMFSPLMTVIVIMIGIPVVSVVIVVVRGIIIAITAIIPCTTCQHKPDQEHYSPKNRSLFIHDKLSSSSIFNLIIKSPRFKVKDSSFNYYAMKLLFKMLRCMTRFINCASRKESSERGLKAPKRVRRIPYQISTRIGCGTGTGKAGPFLTLPFLFDNRVQYTF
jgi:hypothetical protein